jgi:hypothetical protein
VRIHCSEKYNWCTKPATESRILNFRKNNQSPYKSQECPDLYKIPGILKRTIPASKAKRLMQWERCCRCLWRFPYRKIWYYLCLVPKSPKTG